MPFAHRQLDVSVGGRLLKELILGDESREKFGQHLAFGRRRFLNVEQEIAMIDHHRDVLAFELCMSNRSGQGSGELVRTAHECRRAPSCTGGGDRLKLAVEPTDS